MKRVILLFTALSLGYLVNAQTVENITVESENEMIIITYRIGGSTDAQLYNVQLTCSMDGGSRFEPQSVKGDVKNNIRGGRSYYSIEWDVFKDMEEVGSAEFFVKVDLVSDASLTRSQTQPQVTPKEEQNPGSPDYEAVKPQKKEIASYRYFAYVGTSASPLGISFGGLKNFGGYFSMRMGFYTDEFETDYWGTLTTGLTKYIMQKGVYKMHVFGGIGMAFLVENYTYYDESFTDQSFAFDLGVINSIGRLNLIIGLENVWGSGTFPLWGIGFAF